MAKGITEDQVHAAADALVVAGERPTVERIRAFLGSGSPNTAGRWLDTWWAGLGTRLTAQQSKLTLPEAPPEVTHLAGQLWEQALHAAQAQSVLAVQHERQVLADDRHALGQEREALLEEAQNQRAALFGAREARALAEARLEESQRLVDQQAVQLTDLARQRDALQARLTQLEQEHTGLTAHLQRQDAAAAAEREIQTQHMRAVEDRAQAEIDRARQDTKTLRGQLEALQRERAAQEQRTQQRQEEARSALVQAQREAATQQARAETLAQQLAQFIKLPAARAQARKSAKAGDPPVRPRKTPPAVAKRAMRTPSKAP